MKLFDRWPFRTELDKLVEEARREMARLTEADYEVLKAFRSPGESFHYLGKKMLVTQVTVHITPSLFSYPLMRARLEADYLGGDRIKQVIFHASDLPALRAENPDEQ